jgi:hypothetical protein
VIATGEGFFERGYSVKTTIEQHVSELQLVDGVVNRTRFGVKASSFDRCGRY